MVAAVFALVGAALGVLGTLATELSRSRVENIRSRREALRLICADFTSAVARMRELAIDLAKQPEDLAIMASIRAAHVDAWTHFERLRLTSTSYDTQKACRRTLRYAYGIVRQAGGGPPREDERERGALALYHESLLDLTVAVRHELGLPRADDVYREPDEWLGPLLKKNDDGARPIPRYPIIPESGSYQSPADGTI
jgi:hypothetical protein